MGLIEVVTDHLPGAARVPVIHSDVDRRDLRLDACRGLALWFIFIDHIPQNALTWLTLRNYGFSDTTEVFVFVSGYTCMLAYGGALREQGWPTIVTRALRRGSEIYATFLLLLIGYFVVIWIAGGGERYLDDTNTRVFYAKPGTALLHAAMLQYMPVNTDILPTFVLLHLAFPLVLWLLIRSAPATLALSLLLYLMVQIFSWHVPAWPSGELYFNPLAWQILFVFGAWYADEGAGRLRTIVQSRAALVLALLYLAFSLVIALSWEIKALEALIPDALSRLIYPIDKSHLAPLRLLHFLALAILISRLTPAGLARPDEAIDDGDDSLRRKFAGDLLPRGLAVVRGLRGPVRIFRHGCHAGCRQHRRHRRHDRRGERDDLDVQARPSRTKAVLKGGGVFSLQAPPGPAGTPFGRRCGSSGRRTCGRPDDSAPCARASPRRPTTRRGCETGCLHP